jgi:hypothetical protein
MDSEFRLKIPFFERRRRIRLPWTILIFGVIFLSLPVMNYIALGQRLSIPWKYPRTLLGALNPFEIVLLLLPIVIGVGLLMVKRWAWWLFLAYATTLLAYNAAILALSRQLYNVNALVQTAIFVSAVFYFLRRDISAPYLRMYPRGWRLQKRKPIVVEVIVDGIRRTTLDVSDTGIYVDWEDCYRSPGEEVHLTFRIEGHEYKCRAG